MSLTQRSSKVLLGLVLQTNLMILGEQITQVFYTVVPFVVSICSDFRTTNGLPLLIKYIQIQQKIHEAASLPTTFHQRTKQYFERPFNENFIVLFHKCQQLQKMTSSFYYPYFSARNVVLRPTETLQQQLAHHSLNNILIQRRMIEDVVREKEEMINNLRLREYEDELRAKQTISRERDGVGGEERADKQHEAIYRYYQELEYKQIEERRQEEEMHYRAHRKLMDSLKRENHMVISQREEHLNKDLQGKKAHLHDESRRKERETGHHNEQFQSERVIQEYQQELLNKINSAKKKGNVPSKDRDSKLACKYQLDDEAGENIVINKKTIDSHNENTNKNKDTILHLRKKHQKKNSKVSNNDETINIKETIKKQANTIDISSIQQPFLKHKYKNAKTHRPKLNQSCKKAKRSINLSDRKEKKAVPTRANHIIHQQSNPAITSNPLQRIQNRLKLSMIVYQDSRLKNNRYEISHLYNTFDAETRQRKEVKDRINNHPKILLKHNLVVSSR